MLTRGRGGCRGRGVSRFGLRPETISIGQRLLTLPAVSATINEPSLPVSEAPPNSTEPSSPLPIAASTSSKPPSTLLVVSSTSLPLSGVSPTCSKPPSSVTPSVESPTPFTSAAFNQRPNTLSVAPLTSTKSSPVLHFVPSPRSNVYSPSSPIRSIPFVPQKKSKSRTAKKNPINYPTKTTNFVEFFLSQRLAENFNLDPATPNPFDVSKADGNPNERQKFVLYEPVPEKSEEMKAFFSTVGKYRPELKSVSRAISVGDEILCVSGGVNGPSELYLVRAQDWPDRVDNIIILLRHFYSSIRTMSMRYKWVPPTSAIKPGLLVAFYKHDEEDWFRGYILPRMENSNNGFHYIHVLDTGETQYVSERDIFYLDTFFMKEPEIAIKCRLDLGKKFDELHSDEKQWPLDVRDKMRVALFDRRFYVKFNRRVMHRGEGVWEVTLQQFENESKSKIPLKKIIQDVTKQLGISSQ